jgi:hypothetical protein
MKNVKRTEIWEGTLSCKTIRELIEKQKTKELSLSEKNIILEHCMRCKECRNIERKVLDEIIVGFEAETVNK